MKQQLVIMENEPITRDFIKCIHTCYSLATANLNKYLFRQIFSAPLFLSKRTILFLKYYRTFLYFLLLNPEKRKYVRFRTTNVRICTKKDTHKNNKYKYINYLHNWHGFCLFIYIIQKNISHL